MNDNTLCYVFDLTYMPYSFDVYHVLGIMEFERKQQKLDSICLVVLPQDQNRYKIDSNHVYLENDSAQWRESKIFIDSLSLLPSLKSFHFFDTREEGFSLIKHYKHCYPKIFSQLRPEDELHITYAYEHLPFQLILRWLSEPFEPVLTNLRPSSIAIEYVNNWCRERFQDKEIIVINLREAKYYSVRNSDLSQWSKFIATIDHEKYGVVVIRDFDKNTEPLPKEFAPAVQFSEPILSQHIRIALYQKAFVALGDNGGSSTPMLFIQNINCIFFFREMHTSNQAIEVNLFSNLIYKNQMLFTTPNQLFVFQKEEEETDIAKIFQAFERKSQDNKFVNQDVAKLQFQKKAFILKKDIIKDLIVQILSETNCLKRANTLAFFAIEILPVEATESIQRLYYALCLLDERKYPFYDKTTEKNKRIFDAVQYINEKKYLEAKDVLSSIRTEIRQIFPFKNHWTYLLDKDELGEDSFSTCDLNHSEYICPICSNYVMLDTLMSIYLLKRKKNLFFCLFCLHPTHLISLRPVNLTVDNLADLMLDLKRPPKKSESS